MSELANGRCLITGASGFIGHALMRRLAEQGREVRASTRHVPPGDGWVQVEMLGSATDWRSALDGCDTLVHAAGRAHVLRERDGDPLKLFREANVEATRALAEQACAQGVRRFVFLSSIGVNGNATSLEQPFTERDIPRPQADYARSKLEAEQLLSEVFRGTQTELVIIRPPLVYAAHAPGNFARLLGLVHKRLPLPFARVRNARSMVALDNLVDFLVCCLEHPAAANQTFLVADGQDFSTGQLLTLLANGMGNASRSLPVPASWLAVGASLCGLAGVHQQLCGSLRVDIAKARTLLGWQPPVDASQALRDSARQWLENRC
ncbi:NAD-dependent epimerase/dehydratase family protein [Pseudomonas sichuanensis]|uniref:NAD-dependent epimerase/dehydratase family protein n=1 Tax=Pseudomonas TaxID=286 RepID=UPI0036E6C0A4